MFNLVPMMLSLAMLLPASACAIPNEAQDENAPPAEPAAGNTVFGSGYSYSAPEGWGDPPTEVPGFDPDTVVSDLTDSDSFQDNLNTLVDTSIPTSLSIDEVETAVANALEGFGFESVTAEDRLDMAGGTALHFSSTLPLGGEHDVDTYYLTDGSDWVAVTLSTNNLGAGERAELGESVLASWEWD